MKLSQRIEKVSEIVSSQIDLFKASVEKYHDTGDAIYDKVSENIQEKIESLMILMGCDEVIWPGLYPVFVVEGIQYHRPQDALSAIRGFQSLTLVMEFEKENDTALVNEN